MAARIEISNFGPIEHCSMMIDDFTVLTGAQASGKSTVAKCIYFFRTVKDDLLDYVFKWKLDSPKGNTREFIKSFKGVLRKKFKQLFGSPNGISLKMSVTYYFEDSTYIDISILPDIKEKDGNKLILNSVSYFVDFSGNIEKLLEKVCSQEMEKEQIKKKSEALFSDDYEAIFIPAGRNIISLFTSQLSYLFATMDDHQKQSIDYCTQKYIGYILKIQPLFSNGYEGLLNENNDEKVSVKFLTMADKVRSVLKGRYVFENGEERLYLENHSTPSQYVKINYSSSGQQEAVWIFNILYYLIANRTKAFIIVEEPEAHLYPDAQKTIAEILAFMSNSGCQMLITTHSPYILGALNNLIYAGYLAVDHSVDAIVEESFQIKNHAAYYVAEGKIESCLEDEPERLIKNEVIDGASSEVNRLYDALFEMGMSGGDDNAV